MKSVLRVMGCLVFLFVLGCGTAPQDDAECEGPPPDDGCNSCGCLDGEWACTLLACPEPCTAGETKAADDGCNTCICEADGTWACTEIACDTCTEGETKTADDGCNTCFCEGDGTWSCTERACDTCTPGETRGDATPGCPACVCSDDGEWDCPPAGCDEICPAPVAYEGTCVDQAVYVRGSDDETCCQMPDPCSVPDGKTIYNTDKECQAGASVCPAPVASDMACAQVITYGRTGDGLCCEYPTPCSLPDGVEGFPTLAECETGDQTCTEGDTKPAGDGCNTCTCGPNGEWGCTKIGCDPGSCVTDEDCVVTGCSGQLCAPSQMASTCEYLPEYACYRDEITSCGCDDGTCGWAQTDALETCLGR